MKKKNLLLLHGALADKTQFDSLLPYIEDKFNVYTLNLDGHGSNPLHHRHFRIEYFVETVLRYLDKHDLPCVDIFGYSMGGFVALNLASKYVDRVRSVFTLAVKFNWRPEIVQKESTFLNPENLLRKVPQFAKTLKERHTAFGWRNVLDRTTEMFEYLGNNTIMSASDFQKLSIPVRVSVGDKDQMVSIEETVEVFRHIVKGQLQIFPNTLHPFEKISLEELSASINSFFGE